MGAVSLGVFRGTVFDSSCSAHRLTLVIPVQPRNSTVQCFCLYQLIKCTLPFPMHSALAFTSLSSATSGSYTLAASRTFAFRHDLRACRLQSRSLAAPLFSYSLAPIRKGYELLFPPARRTLGGQTLCFDNHPHCPGVWGSNSSPAPVFLCALCVSVANPFFSYYCELFVVAKKVIRLGIRNFRTLLQKHPGWGVSIHDKLVSRSRSPWSSQPRDVSVRRFSPSHEQSRRSSSGTTTYTRQPYASLCAARRSTCRASPSVAHVLSLSSPLRVLPLREAYVSKSLCRERAVGARAAAQKGTTKP